MKINGINNINNNINVFCTNNSVKANENKRNDAQLMSNSISEAIGRSQVSFKGKTVKKGSSYVYESRELFQKDKIQYNPKTGEFHQCSYYTTGGLKEEIYCVPADGVDIHKKFEKDGSSTIINRDGDCVYTEKYNGDNEKTYEGVKNIVTGNSQEIYYDIDTGSTTVVNVDGDCVYTEEYNSDNEKTFESVENRTTGSYQETIYEGDKTTIKDFYPGSDSIQKATVFRDGNFKREITYDRAGNKLKDVRNFDNGVQTIDLYRDGKIVKQKKFNDDGELFYVCEYYNSGAKLYEKVIAKNGEIEEKKYREDGTLLSEKITSFGQIEENIYWEDGQTPKHQRYYDTDGSYTQTDFDKQGRCYKFGIYDKNGREIVKRPPKKFDESEFLANFSKVSKRNMGTDDLKTFAKIIGFKEDISKLRNMDKTTYRILIKQFHPDLHPNDKRAEVICQIINNLNSGD